MEPRNEQPGFTVYHLSEPVAVDPPHAAGAKPRVEIRSREPERLKSAHPILYPGLTWLLGLMIGVVMLRYFVPQLAEQIQYSITRGEQRAKYDVAGEHINNTSLSDLSLAYQRVSHRVSPSVVHIGTVRLEDARTVDDEADGNERLKELLGRAVPRQSRGQGSGVIVDPAGYIVTNYHVIHGAKEIFVQLSDGRQFDAQRVGDDGPTDLAVLKIDADGLIAADWGDSEKLEVGSLVWAVGSPFGLDRSITSGIISAKHRRAMAHSAYQDFLQTDAAVNPGNSGGPLVDEQGRIVGINTAIIGETFHGISFALPSRTARRVYDDVKQHGRVLRGWLGVGLEEVGKDRADELGLLKAIGVYIPHVVEDGAQPSPAARAGIKPGDVIIRWNGQDVLGPVELSNLVADTNIGDTIDVVVFRNRAERTVQVIVGERPMELN